MNYEELIAIIPEGEGRYEILFEEFEETEVERLFRRFFDVYAFENKDGETEFVEGLVIDGEVVEDEESETITVSGTLYNTFLGAVSLEDIDLGISAVFSISEAAAPRVSISLSFEQPWTLVSALAEEELSVLNAELSGEASKNLAFPVSSVELESEAFQLSIAVEPELPLNLDTVPQFLQGVGVVDQFPSDGFPSFDTGLSLTLFQLSAGLDPLRLAGLDMEVALGGGNGEWSTFGGFVVFRDLQARFTLDDPLGAKALTAVVNGAATVAGVAIGGRIELPALTFACFLEENATIEIKALLEELTGVPLPMSAVTCTAFLMEGVPEERTYSLNATIEDLMELDLGISTLRLEELSTAFTMITAEQPGGQRSVSGWISGSVLFGEVPFVVTAELEEGASGWTFSGGLADEGTLTIDALFTNLSDTFGKVQLPPSLAGLEVEELSVRFDTAEKNFLFSMGLHFPVDGKELELSMTLEVTKTARGYTKRFTGTTIIQKKLFLVEFGKSPTRSHLLARFEDADGFELNPITLLDEVSASHGLSLGDDSQGLTQLEIYSLGFLMESEKTNGTVRKIYTFDGAAAWTTEIPFSVEEENIRIDAELLIRKVVKGGLSGRIRGRLSTNVPFFEHFPLTAVYDFSPGKRTLGFELPIGNILLKLDYETRTLSPGPPPRKQTILSLATGVANGSEEGLTFGDIISFLVGLIDPDTVYFQLDPPWDLLNEVSLSGFSLEINMTTKAVTVSYASQISLGFMTITKLGLAYVPPRPGRPKGVNIVLEGSFLGSERTLAWDAVNDAPPAVPGKGSTVFDLRYLGIGQRVSLNPEDVAQLQDITAVMTLLRSSLTPLPPAKTRYNPLAVAAAEGREVIRFNADSGFLLGASLVLMGAFDLRIIFNDPLLYGLRIELSGPAAKQLKGLKFEILYRRVTDTIGVYHIDLTLPDALRNLQFGAVSVTIPVIVLDIFTNGDFKIDIGFPWRNNFARSFGVQIFPFIGAAGIYFNKLSAETATGPYPPRISNGEFDPIIEFGFGLKIGLGKSFNKGVLRAELSVSIQGILEGVISWFNPDDAALSKEQYYRIKGSVALVGRIYGAVDFKVIRVDVEVLIRATVLFVVEVYQPIPITLIAEVSVRASVKILFITIKFSFYLKVSFNFTVGSAQPTPWVLGSRERGHAIRAAAFTVASRSFSAATLAQQLAALEIEETSAPTPLSWQPVAIWEGGDKKIIDLFLQPAFTKDHEGVKGVAQLFIENAIDPAELDHENYAKAEETPDSDFDMLMHGLLTWALYAYYTPPEGEETGGAIFSLKEKDISREELENLYNFFIEDREDPSHPFNFERLSAFLAGNYIFHVSDAARLEAFKGQIGGTLFPVFPQLLMEIDGEEIDFDGDQFKLTADDLNRYRAYFQDLQVQHGHSVESNGSSAGNILDNTGEAFTATTFVFLDYFAMLIRTGIQSAIDYMERQERSTIRQAELLSALNRNGQYNHIAGMTSRFMLHGLRLPDERGQTSPVFVETGQQYAITIPQNGNPEEASPSRIRLKKAADADLPWLTFIEFQPPDTGEEAPKRAVLNVLDYQYPGPIVELIGKLHRESPADDLPKPALMSPLEVVPRRFALTKEITWSAALEAGNTLDESLAHLSPSANFALLELPQTLLTELTQSVPGLTLFGEETQPGGMELKRTPESNLLWATRIEVQLKPIPAAVPSGKAEPAVLKHSFALDGLSEGNKDLLEDVFLRIAGETPDYAVRLFLLHPPEKNGAAQDLEKTTGLLTNRAVSRCYLVKTNLSTNSGRADEDAPDTYIADLVDGPAFLQLLWEGAAVNTGGYYLYYEYKDTDGTRHGLPSHLFAGEPEATVSLLCVCTPEASAGQTSNRPERFHNCLLMNRTRFDQLESWSLETEPLERVLRIPPGNIGFELERENPFLTPDKELDNIYQLLGYRLLENAGFSPKKNKQEGLPVGPVEHSSETSRWIYEKVVPAYYFARESRLEAGSSPGLPPAAQDPYAGIGSGTDAQLSLQFFWQDLFGNRLSEDGTAVTAGEYPVRYFDPLIGINQWPSVIESFGFEAGEEEEVLMQVSFYQDQRPYIPGTGQLFDEVMERIRIARATYEKVYYQIRQPDIAFDIRNSVLPETALKTNIFQTLKSELRLFVDQAYLFLGALEHLEPYRHPVTATNTFGSLSSAFHVPVALLAEENRQLEGIFTTGMASPLKIPVTYEIQPGDTLAGLAGEMVLPPNRIEDWVKKTAEQNQDLANLFAPGVQITLGGEEYTVQPEDTLRSIATASELSPASVAMENQNRPGVLNSGTLLKVTLDYEIRETDSLEMIQQKILAMEAFEQVNLRPGDIAKANPAHRLNPGKDLRIPGRIALGANFPESQLLEVEGSLSALVAQLNDPDKKDRIRVMEVVMANQGLHNLLEVGVSVSLKNNTLTTNPFDTFASLLSRFQALSGESIGFAELSEAIAEQDGLLKPGVRLIRPPLAAGVTATYQRTSGDALNYPGDLIFPVWVKIDMRRGANYVNAALAAEAPEIQQVSAYLSPRMAPPLSQAESEEAASTASLRPFARGFERALPGLRLAAGTERSRHNPSAPDPELQFERSLWAVHFETVEGDVNLNEIDLSTLHPRGIFYNIHEDRPLFFALAPLSNTLQLGTMEAYQYIPGTGIARTPEGQALTEPKSYEGIDLNTLAQDFLENLEAILSPEVVIPVLNRNSPELDTEGIIGSLLEDKTRLAGAIRDQQLTSILDVPVEDRRLKAARDSLYQQLLVNLADAYKLETLVQYQVDVKLPEGFDWPGDHAPRLSGKPDIEDLTVSSDIDPRAVDLTLSSGKLALDEQGAYLTFALDTKTPERFEDLQLQLRFRITGMEYNIVDVQGIKDYQASSWLSFVNPVGEGEENGDPTDENDPNFIGSVKIPIPLRTYPIPPSFILHRAEADPDSQKQLEKIREWQYAFTYEHPDTAQDTIEGRVAFNVRRSSQADVFLDKRVAAKLGEMVEEHKNTANLLLIGAKLAVNGQEYTVKADDTLSSIAAAMKTDLDTLVDAIDERDDLLNPALKILDQNIKEGDSLITLAQRLAPVRKDLFSALLNFKALYPAILADLNAALAIENSPAGTELKAALDAFRFLVNEVATAWKKWTPESAPNAISEEEAGYEINEVAKGTLKNMSIRLDETSTADDAVLRRFPEASLPGYRLENMSQPLCFGAGGRLLFSRNSGNLYSWNLDQPVAAPLVFDLPEELESAAAISPDARWLVRGYEDGEVRIWSISSFEEAPVETLQTNRPVNAIAFSPDSQWMVLAGDDVVQVYQSRLFDTEAVPAFEFSLSSPSPVSALAINGHQVLTGCRDGGLYLWEITGTRPVRLLTEQNENHHPGRISSLVFSRAGRQAASASQDGNIYLWTFEPTASAVFLGDAGNRVNELIFHPNGEALVFGDWNGSVWLHGLPDTGSGNEKEQAPPLLLGRHETAISSLAFDAAGDQLAASVWDGQILRWTQNEAIFKQETNLDLKSIEGGRTIKYHFEKKSDAEATLDPVFGESDIPDRSLRLTDLDILRQQNAWAAIWLTRNKELLKDEPVRTNPIFEFQTPLVRFNNWATPFLVNDERWDISLVGGDGKTPQTRSLEGHLQRLFELLLPELFDNTARNENSPFELRLNVRYAFTFARGRGLNEDLLSAVPVLLGLRLRLPIDDFNGYLSELAREINQWFDQHQPYREKGASYLFSLSLFSKLDPDSRTSLPMLKVEHLELPLQYIE